MTGTFFAIAGSPLAASNPSSPNIVLIMADDLGFSDLGCYGGEIKTPHIDSLAEKGTRFTRFYNTGRCCPSRAALMTGKHQHSVGIGWMTAVDEHRPGYRGQLTPDIPTLAELLRQNGYATAISGKWHLTLDLSYRGIENPKPNGSWPTERGFDRFFGTLAGGGGYWKNSIESVFLDTEQQTLPDGFYYTHAITEHAVRFIEEHEANKPFFLYLAHYAPHRPLSAPGPRIKAVRDRYLAGSDTIRKTRFEKQIDLGIIAKDSNYPNLSHQTGEKATPSWSKLKPKQQEAWVKEMATYAAMVEIMDDGIGEVIAAMKAKGLHENTVYIFLSDNGATKEGGLMSQIAAGVSNVPFRGYKKSNYLGGIGSPLIVALPSGIGSGEISQTPTHITDLVPTCLDLAGAGYPESFNEKKTTPPHGTNLLPIINGATIPARNLYFEHSSYSSIISGEWKLVRGADKSPWELYNLNKDPYEQDEITTEHPDVVTRLTKSWQQWAKNNQVLPLHNDKWNDRIKHFSKQNSDQDGID